MGIACKAEVDLQTLRESSYYQLDTGLKMQCEADVAKLCEGVDEGREGHSLVLKCLVDHHSELAGPCQTEVSCRCEFGHMNRHQAAVEISISCFHDFEGSASPSAHVCWLLGMPWNALS